MHPAISLYRALYAAARQQAQALAKGDLDRFFELMGERETLLERVEDAGPPSDEPERQRAAALVRQILRLDEANADLLRQLLDSAQRELDTVRSGQRVVRSYRPAVDREARFIDRGG